MAYCDNETSFDLVDDGTLDTVLDCTVCGETLRFATETAAPYRDDDGALDLDAFVINTDMEHESDSD